MYNSLKRKIESGENPEQEIEYQDPLISDMQLAYQTEQTEDNSGFWDLGGLHVLYFLAICS